MLPCNSPMTQFTSFQTFLNAGLIFRLQWATADNVLTTVHKIFSPYLRRYSAKLLTFQKVLRPPGFIKCQNKTIAHTLFVHYHEEKFTLCLTKYHNTSSSITESFSSSSFFPSVYFQPSAALLFRLLFWGSVRPELLSSEPSRTDLQQSLMFTHGMLNRTLLKALQQRWSTTEEETRGSQRKIGSHACSFQGIFHVSSSG